MYLQGVNNFFFRRELMIGPKRHLNRFRTVLDCFRTASDRFRTVSDCFRTVLDRFQTASDSVGSFSDRFGWFRIVSDRFRIVFEPFRIVSNRFGRLWCVFGPFSGDSTQNFKISNFNWPGLGGTARTDGTARTGPSPGQLKFKILKF